MFEVNQVYKRSDLHDSFGGQRQGGISTPAKHNIILIFTGQSGEKHGYKDEWQDGLFYYTGEGQLGDMSFVRGNLAIRDHVKRGKELHLFSTLGNAQARYDGQLEFKDYRYQDGPGTDGAMRKMIVFELAPVS